MFNGRECERWLQKWSRRYWLYGLCGGDEVTEVGGSLYDFSCDGVDGEI